MDLELLLLPDVVEFSAAFTSTAGVGANEASTVGLCVGAELGALVDEGVPDGAIEGAAVGLLVGAREGDLVGPLGREEGWPVGAEGFGVGVNDGL